MKNTDLVLYIKYFYEKKKNLAFVLKNADKIFMKNTDLVLEVEKNEIFVIDFLVDLKS